MNLDRIGDITSELSSSLVRSIVIPGGSLLGRLYRPLRDHLRDWQRGLRPEAKFAAPQAARTAAAEAAASFPLGPILCFGGAPVPDEGIVEFMHMAGGRSARIAIIPMTSDPAHQAGADGLRLFARYGMRGAALLPLLSQELADDPTVAAAIREADAVFLCGPDTELGVRLLGNTRCGAALRAHVEGGKPLAGMEGGAVVLGECYSSPSADDPVLMPGLGLLPGLMIESGFAELSRFRPMAKALRTGGGTPSMGAGVDAGAVLVLKASDARVVGEGSVTFMDATDLAAKVDDSPCPPGALCGLKVHVLTEGFGLNLRTRKPTGPVKEQVPVASGR